MRIAAGHAEQGNPLLHALGAALEALGAEVTVSQGGENLVRRTGAARTFAIPPAHAPHPVPACAEIHVEGLPNLLHEAAHVVLSGCLDDDHGIDYAAIPFDLTTSSGRAVLFEELACCVLSCSYLASDAARDAWFVEQVEIQPVFYGMEHDVPGFWRVVADAYAAHRDEADAIVDAAFDRLEILLRWSGAPATLASVAVRSSLADMLGRHAASVA
jgi:hypothetical protein